MCLHCMLWFCVGTLFCDAVLSVHSGLVLVFLGMKGWLLCSGCALPIVWLSVLFKFESKCSIENTRLMRTVLFYETQWMRIVTP